MENQDISKETLKKIEEEKITPTPKWCFVCGDYSLWALAVVSIIIGILALGVIVFLIVSQDWQIHNYLQGRLFWHVMISVPYLWIFILAIFFVFGYYIFRNTKIGYRYQTYLVLVIGLSIILVFAIASFLLNISSQIHSVLSRQIPLYSNLIHDKNDDAILWENQEKGLLTGKVVGVVDSADFLIIDIKGKAWNIKIDPKKISGEPPLKIGQTVRLTGAVEGPGIFLVNKIYK